MKVKKRRYKNFFSFSTYTFGKYADTEKKKFENFLKPRHLCVRFKSFYIKKAFMWCFAVVCGWRILFFTTIIFISGHFRAFQILNSPLNLLQLSSQSHRPQTSVRREKNTQINKYIFSSIFQSLQWMQERRKIFDLPMILLFRTMIQLHSTMPGTVCCEWENKARKNVILYLLRNFFSCDGWKLGILKITFKFSIDFKINFFLYKKT